MSILTDYATECEGMQAIGVKIFHDSWPISSIGCQGELLEGGGDIGQ
jgi:hypothetical protein